MRRKGKFPPLLARVTCLQQVINCIAYVAGVERDGGGEERRDKGERIFPFPYRAFLPLPSRLFYAPATQAINCSECF